MGLRVFPQGDKVIIEILRRSPLTTTQTFQLFYGSSGTAINLPDEDLEALGRTLLNAARLLDV